MEQQAPSSPWKLGQDAEIEAAKMGDTERPNRPKSIAQILREAELNPYSTEESVNELLRQLGIKGEAVRVPQNPQTRTELFLSLAGWMQKNPERMVLTTCTVNGEEAVIIGLLGDSNGSIGITPAFVSLLDGMRLVKPGGDVFVVDVDIQNGAMGRVERPGSDAEPEA